MKLYKAGIEDIQELVQLRIDFLEMMEKGSMSEKDKSSVRRQTEDYFKKHIPLNDVIVFIVKENQEIASAAFLLIHEQPANLSFITGVKGTLINVITYPPYRRQGLATMVIKQIIQEAAGLGVSSIDLMATEAGFEVYKKLGFEKIKHIAMRLKLV